MRNKPVLTLSAFLLGVMIALLAFTNQSQASSVESLASSVESLASSTQSQANTDVLPASFVSAPLFEPHLENAGAICPLSQQQQTDSIAKFAEMVPTFQHPRCANCHGGVRPLSNDDSHAGGKFDVTLDEYGNVDTVKTFAECQSCHSGLPGWEVPRSDVWFVEKDAVELCKQMKFELKNAERWIDHITRDRGGPAFIETGFAGMRGLDQDGIDYYEALFDKLPEPEPPPGSHAGLIDMAKAWVDAMGGEFQGDESCGCEPQQYAIQIDETFMAEVVGEGATVTWDGGSNFRIPITFKDDGTFTGQVTADRRMHAVLSSAVLTCDQTSLVPTTWQVEGSLIDDDDEGDYLLRFSIRVLLAPSSISCSYGATIPVPIYDTEAADNPFRMIEMEAFVDETTTVELRSNLPTSNGKFVVTLVKVE